MMFCAYDAAKTGAGVRPSAPKQGSAAEDAAADEESAEPISALTPFGGSSSAATPARESNEQPQAPVTMQVTGVIDGPTAEATIVDPAITAAAVQTGTAGGMEHWFRY